MSGPTVTQSAIPLAQKNAASGVAGLASDTTVPYTLLRVPIVTPEDFGAVGTGLIDDTAALISAIGTGLRVELNPTKTYLVSRQIGGFAVGQVLEGHGATIKRAAQVSTTTTTTITSGVTTAVTVASTTGLVVGQTIVADGGGSSYDQSGRTIQSIVGSVVTVSSAFGVSLSGTTNIRTAGYIFAPAKSCEIRNVKFDGNRSNWTWAKWWHTASINVAANADNVLIDHCHFSEVVAEGVIVNDAHSCRVQFCTFENVNGNGVHFGGSVACAGGRVVFNRFKSINLDAANVEHGEGAVCVSAFVSDLLVHGNHIDTALSAVGSIDSATNNDITFSDNEVRNMTLQAFEGVMDLNGGSSRVTVTGNRFYNNAQFKLNGGSSSTTLPKHWKVTDNLFYETTVYIGFAEGFQFQGNTIVLATFALGLELQGIRGGSVSGNVFDNCWARCTGSAVKTLQIGGNVWMNAAKASSATTLLQIVGAKAVLVDCNVFEDGGWAVRIDTSGTADVRVCNNVCRNQGFFGVYVVTTGLTNVAVDGNTLTNDSASDNTYVGIRALGSARIRGNDVWLAKGANGIQISATSDKAIVKDNSVKGSTVSIRIDSSVTNAQVKDNEVDVAITDGGTTTTATGTLVVA